MRVVIQFYLQVFRMPFHLLKKRQSSSYQGPFLAFYRALGANEWTIFEYAVLHDVINLEVPVSSRNRWSDMRVLSSPILFRSSVNMAVLSCAFSSSASCPKRKLPMKELVAYFPECQCSSEYLISVAPLVL